MVDLVRDSNPLDIVQVVRGRHVGEKAKRRRRAFCWPLLVACGPRGYTETTLRRMIIIGFVVITSMRASVIADLEVREALSRISLSRCHDKKFSNVSKTVKILIRTEDSLCMWKSWRGIIRPYSRCARLSKMLLGA